MAHYTRLEQTSAAFNDMISRFGVVTVMNAYVYDALTVEQNLTNHKFSKNTADAILDSLVESRTNGLSYKETAESGFLCKLDTLKIANISQEGPTKTVTGGQNASPLLKFGKTARLEMQDALGNIDALEALGGLTKEWVKDEEETTTGTETIAIGIHASDQFPGPKTIVGDTFFIDQKTGNQVKVAVLIYQFVPDSVFNLTQDAEGDATVFDLNGDLVATEILLGDKDGNLFGRNVFYSVLNPMHEHSN